MTKPFRLRVLDKLTAVLETVTPANGYTHTLTGSVFRGRNVFGSDDPLPMVSILEHPTPTEAGPSPIGATGSSGEWRLIIQGFAKDDYQHPTDPAHLLAAEVVKALSLERQKAQDFKLLDLQTGPSRVEDLRIGSPLVRPPDEVSAKAYFWLTLTLDIVEDQADPHA